MAEVSKRARNSFNNGREFFNTRYYFRFAFGETEEFADDAAEDAAKSAKPTRITVFRVVISSGFSVQIPWTRPFMYSFVRSGRCRWNGQDRRLVHDSSDRRASHKTRRK